MQFFQNLACKKWFYYVKCKGSSHRKLSYKKQFSCQENQRKTNSIGGKWELKLRIDEDPVVGKLPAWKGKLGNLAARAAAASLEKGNPMSEFPNGDLPALPLWSGPEDGDICRPTAEKETSIFDSLFVCLTWLTSDSSATSFDLNCRWRWGGGCCEACSNIDHKFVSKWFEIVQDLKIVTKMFIRINWKPSFSSLASKRLFCWGNKIQFESEFGSQMSSATIVKKLLEVFFFEVTDKAQMMKWQNLCYLFFLVYNQFEAIKT